MAPVLSQEDQQSKAWWSLSKSPSTKDLRQAYSQGKPPTSHTKSGKLNSLATAIGFKSKKNFSSLAIQAPPTPVITDIPKPDAPATYNISPHPAKKQTPAKLTRSRANSTAPHTPVEIENEKRNSLLTLSDADPFAGRPMVAPPIAHMPLDPNRLSAYSSPSVSSIVPKKADPSSNFNRVSYASSSSNSNSNSHAMDRSTASSMNSPTGAAEYRQLNTKRSVPSLQAKRPEGVSRQASLSPACLSSPKSGGTAPMHTAPPLSSQSEVAAPPRPKMRARGMTDLGPSHRPAFFLNDLPGPRRQLSHKASSDFYVQPSDTNAYNEASFSKSPKVVIRKPSVPHMHHAPTAPPTQRLPPPPIPQTEDFSTSKVSLFSPTTSFSSSFVGNTAQSLHQDNRKGFGNRHKSDADSVISFAQAASSTYSPQTLKKSISHNSLKTRYTHAALSTSPTKYPEDVSTDKGTRKPRIFPHPRLPIPPIPPSIRPSTSPGLTSFPSTSESGQSPVSNKRSSQVSSSRKRLFSNSSRLSTSHNSAISREDDTQSIFSLQSDVDAHLSHFKPWLTTPKSKSAPSFWDEERSHHIPNSPIFPAQEFAPQSIISPADVEKLEATVENHIPGQPSGSRPRGFSILSASTVFSDFSIAEDVDSLAPVTLSPPPLSRASSNHMSVHESPMRRERPSQPGSPTLSNFFDDRNIPSLLPVEPFPTVNARSPVMGPSPTPNAGIMSLPPPPRRGRKATLVSHPDIPEMTVAPPIATTLPLTIHKSSSIRSNSKTIVDKAHPSRQTVMRKPSFLDIDDEPDLETDRNLMTDSFLDLARESFDTTR